MVPRARAHVLLREQRRVNDQEVALREQLQAAYQEQEALLQKLQDTSREQDILVQQQQELLAEVDRLYREQAQAAITDAVTGLPNHRAVMNRLDEEISRSLRASSMGSNFDAYGRTGEVDDGDYRGCAVLFVDLDHFKQINDTYGHRAGDAILCEVGRRLRVALRLEDFVGRYGGEEFAVVYTNVNQEEAIAGAERLRVVISAEPYSWDAEDGQDGQDVVSISITASIGVTVFQRHGVTCEELIEAADQAMYRAKHKGRNRVCVASVGLPTVLLDAPPSIERDRAVIGVVQALTAAANASDRGTDEHAQRMVRLAEETARVLGCSDEYLHLLRLAVLLHDIGKIGIPDAILHKPGPLNDEEWTVMRRHPDIGRSILEETGGVFELLAHVVAAHHERWDGRGYPNGLSGEAIPLHARIIAVVDAYDAMTVQRVYRDPISPEAACAELRRCAGSQFDPQVVAAFLCVLALPKPPSQSPQSQPPPADKNPFSGERGREPAPA